MTKMLNIPLKKSKNIGAVVREVCSIRTIKNKFPVLKWLPNYKASFLAQDIIAGITVALTAIPQGIAYAVAAGLTPEYGLYTGMMGGFVYMVFGSCRDLTIGANSVVTAIITPYVTTYSADFSVLATFIAGIIELATGVLRLGFLVKFISKPVINGFTTSAALQIGSSQLKMFFALDGQSGNNFGESTYRFVKSIKTAKLWDPLLGLLTIFLLYILKQMGNGCKRTDGTIKQLRWFLSLARNAVVIVIGIIIAYIIKVTTDSEPIVLIGDIQKGLPKPSLPPFETIVGNETYTFTDMMKILGPQTVVLPMVAILETIAIAQAFAAGTQVDASQEMIALGMCNIVGSFIGSMPTTGSFTRTALNNAAGVETQAGGIISGVLIMLALSLLTSTFYYIPKSALAGLVITAMYYLTDFKIFGKLWNVSKREFFALLVTVLVCLTYGLEFGILAGVAFDGLALMFNLSKPDITVMKSANEEITVVSLTNILPYSAAENIRWSILKASNIAKPNSTIVIDGKLINSMDYTVVSTLMSTIKDVESHSQRVILLNFSDNLKTKCLQLCPLSLNKFKTLSNNEDLIDFATSCKSLNT